ncbi:MAG TPA: efflux RND transporter periplasmic adaptor subunit [Peptococcaceae bacterium]|jgi:cobalt-zinc-cadmium efflux system membrane fusion protein|nr:efflux RND transporter periplasmic adaptor subunit [Clostridia bacterium]HOB82098.1 efflux RND transporter periplasmic adaptor subunit [Peptococcaceae bacterium]HPZ71868.1 efflux RND transporter periplasmic adaptor subunit [Peptococcaceae bacterium]HQD54206.1 efflux RND transporter periplasmic adaptor subunit [Peptococcaceae bacterium]
MKKKIVILLIGLLLVAAFVWKAGSVLQNKGEGGELLAPVAEEQSKIPVTVEQVQKGTLERKIPLGGLLKAREEVMLAAKNPSLQIVSVPVEVGDYVSVGTPLVIFDSREIDLQLEQAQLAYDRNKELFAAGAVSQFQLEQSETALQSLQLQKENCVLNSTINGYVAAVTAVEGQLAGASPLVTVVNTEQLELTVQVGENYVGGLKLGQQVDVKVSAASRESFPAVIKTIAPKADAMSKAFPVTLSLSNRQKQLKDGMYGEIELVVDRREDVIVIPQYAVLDHEGKKKVFVVENGVAREKEVELGLALGERVELTKGLKVGELLVVEGQYGIKDGTLVEWNGAQNNGRGETK